MALDRDLHDRNLEDRSILGSPSATTSASFIVPLALVVASALMGWILYGSLSPTVDNTGTTVPVTQTDLPQAAPKPPTP